MTLRNGETEIAQGKTKIIVRQSHTNLVRIISKDDITAGDGARRDVMVGKAELATTTTVNCFKYLKAAGVPTHFKYPFDETSYVADWVDTIPLEVVTRRIAFGSYRKRNPKIPEGHRFDHLVTELYFKDDINHDPLVLARPGGGWLLFDAKRPLSADPISELDNVVTTRGVEVTHLHAVTLHGLVETVFTHLEAAWAAQDVTLVDLKIEGGFPLDGAGNLSGPIVVADVIDNDSCRIWPGGVAAKMLDKETYRRATEVTADVLGSIKSNYALVADMTGHFID